MKTLREYKKHKSWPGRYLIKPENLSPSLAKAMDIVRETLAKKKLIEDIIRLINNDAYCLSFQTIGQYRTALIKEIYKIVGGKR
jgi:hypothetical protein